MFEMLCQMGAAKGRGHADHGVRDPGAESSGAGQPLAGRVQGAESRDHATQAAAKHHLCSAPRGRQQVGCVCRYAPPNRLS